MDTRRTASRALQQLAILFMLAGCGAESPEVSSGSARHDSAANGAAHGAADRPSTLSSERTDPQPNAQLLTPDGWGPLRIGMTRAEVVAAAGEDANPDAAGGPDPDRCDEFRPGTAPAGVLVMVENDVLTRISVSRNSNIRTPAGLRVGDDIADVLAQYGSRARVDPHQYWAAPASYVTVQSTTSADSGRGIRYEVDAGGKVVHLRAGGRSIKYTEGCV